MRVLSWFSCGAASAVAAHYAIKEYGDRVEVAYCDTMSTEHPDNARFFDEVQDWLGVPITRLHGDYESIDEVFAKTRYMAGISGARCTGEMKKIPRIRYERPDDTHVFGFTFDERKRIQNFRDNNFEMSLDFVLDRLAITKDNCFHILERAGIELPVMYGLGYKNNNCLGCVKASSAGYWNMIRRDFPDVFERRCQQSRELGVRLTRVRGTRVFLDELPEDYIPAEPLEDISCGPDCGTGYLYDKG